MVECESEAEIVLGLKPPLAEELRLLGKREVEQVVALMLLAGAEVTCVCPLPLVHLA
jgi:hypothetical protein